MKYNFQTQLFFVVLSGLTLMTVSFDAGQLAAKAKYGKRQS